MENQSGTQSSNIEDTVKQQENEPENKTTVTQNNDAGPSQTYNLPGSVPFKATPSLKVSKSEQSIRQTHANPDVPALILTSTSFGAQGHELNSTNTKPSNVEGTNEDNTTFAEMKKILASYFRINKDNQVAVAAVQNTPALIVATVQDDTSCVVAAQTEDKSVLAANEVIVTNQPTPETELSKCVSENKKKTPDSLSEKSGFGVVQRDSLSSIGSNVCRICMTRGRERLISPCNCKGSLANVHLTCLERWLNQVGRNHCELCGFSYPAIRTPRYTVLQALRLWFGNPRNRSHLQSDCLIFWLLSTVTAGLLAVCIVGTQYFVMEGNKFGKAHGIARKEEGISHRITETAMDFFMAIVLCGYSVTVYLLCKDHYVLWNRWRRANVHVRLLLSADADPVPFAPRRYNNIV